VNRYLKCIFMANYSVSLAARIIPAADLSEQISTAGYEASGTGNMKLALNGALTIATRDGANVEICDAVGEDNIWMFGGTFERLQAMRAGGYDPRAIYEGNLELRNSLNTLRDGYFLPQDRSAFLPIYRALLEEDRYMVLADYDDYMRAQASVDEAYRDRQRWQRMAILNVARMGPFSMDRLVREYAREVWGAAPVAT
ncbi:MAG: glycogen/starch/alpha-glucan phosphorylase, partial [Alphaproteobacteria bacterium]|nr:glycogen/starch/alpha-glucan phosphorylase [Alphaproteobacteria bacterium]